MKVTNGIFHQDLTFINTVNRKEIFKYLQKSVNLVEMLMSHDMAQIWI